VVRDGKVIHTASGVDSLKVFKDDVKVVEVGDECGISLTGFQEFKAGDKLQSYDEKETDFAEVVNRQTKNK
jgi:translation initiation factor IF-2